MNSIVNIFEGKSSKRCGEFTSVTMDAAEWNVRGLAGLSRNASGRVSATKRKTTTAQIKNLQLTIRKLIAQNNREEINLVGSWLTDVFHNILFKVFRSTFPFSIFVD